jgi:hypothetical protein
MNKWASRYQVHCTDADKLTDFHRYAGFILINLNCMELHPVRVLGNAKMRQQFHITKYMTDMLYFGFYTPQMYPIIYISVYKI